MDGRSGKERLRHLGTSTLTKTFEFGPEGPEPEPPRVPPPVPPRCPPPRSSTWHHGPAPGRLHLPHSGLQVRILSNLEPLPGSLWIPLMLTLQVVSSHTSHAPHTLSGLSHVHALHLHGKSLCPQSPVTICFGEGSCLLLEDPTPHLAFSPKRRSCCSSHVTESSCSHPDRRGSSWTALGFWTGFEGRPDGAFPRVQGTRAASPTCTSHWIGTVLVSSTSSVLMETGRNVRTPVSALDLGRVLLSARSPCAATGKVGSRSFKDLVVPRKGNLSH